MILYPIITTAILLIIFVIIYLQSKKDNTKEIDYHPVSLLFDGLEATGKVLSNILIIAISVILYLISWIIWFIIY